MELALPAGRARQMMRIIDNAAWRVGASMA